jgi:pyruvate formate lyase activating enzyme
MEKTGTIFDIQRFAVHDGPGIRSTVFFKGCSCRCVWCHNPESLSIKPEIEFYPSRCIGCGKCFSLCPLKLHTLKGEVHYIDRSRCTGCGACTRDCYANALVLKGKTVTLSELTETIMSDKAYYEESGGGVTLSGGEPVLQSSFASELLSAVKLKGIHTAVQTAGNYNYAILEPLLPHLDLIMFDLKGFSPDIYTRYIYGDRDQIINNLETLGTNFKGTLAVRTPCIGGLNDSPEEIESMAKFLSGLGKLNYYQLIPYHGLAKVKYDALEKVFSEQCYTPAPDAIRKLEKLAAQYIPVFNQDKGFINREDK